MKEAKIRLSAKETELVQNKEWILTKNIILQKVVQLFGVLQEGYQQHLHQTSSLFTTAVITNPAKISRGENYEGLPYRVLDYPAIFQKNNILAVRTIFWWGNFFSTTLHLSGIYKEQLLQKILNAYPVLSNNQFYISCGEDEWSHQIDSGHYLLIDKLSKDDFSQLTIKTSFIKIAAKTGIADWSAVATALNSHFVTLTALLKD